MYITKVTGGIDLRNIRECMLHVLVLSYLTGYLYGAVRRVYPLAYTSGLTPLRWPPYRRSLQSTYVSVDWGFLSIY